MEIFPSERQTLDLKRYEKIFATQADKCSEYGFAMLRVNPSMTNGDSMTVVITSKGVVCCKFFEDYDDIDMFESTMKAYKIVHDSIAKIISDKVKSNKTLIDENKKLRFPISLVNIFPKIKNENLEQYLESSDVKKFSKECCMFSEDFNSLRKNFINTINQYLEYPMCDTSNDSFEINDLNVNAIIQRLAPEYVTVRVANIQDEETSAGADEELLIVNENDLAVKAFRLDEDQINIINKISKGDQLILACAGSGKSVLLISKCFKAAQMNPDKKFLITCKNKNLYSLYLWFIDAAGLKAKNVQCFTFHKLCKHLLENNGFHAKHEDFDGWVTSVSDKLNRGQISERYYGIFIDEVQMFEQEWYKICYNLLENKSSDDHLFVICGDKTQKLDKQKKRGTAPWQGCGEGYPVFRGGHKNIRIEKNYRNCVEINEFINRFVSNAKEYLFSIEPNAVLDPDEFLRGQAVRNGNGVEIKRLIDFSDHGEVLEILKSIKYIHDVQNIPYDEIAVIMYNGTFGKLSHWRGRYNLENTLEIALVHNRIQYSKLYNSSNGAWADNYGEKPGVKLTKLISTLGIDFRAAIICGLKPFGVRENVKKPDWDSLRKNDESYYEALSNTETLIKNLYVACTRAKETLHIILPETSHESEFIKLLEKSK